MIQVTDLSKRFGKVQAVERVSFMAPDGRITGLLGPNGAGKSTTLRMLATLLRPDSGDAMVDGQSAIKNPIEVKRRIGVLSHASGLYPQLTARENIMYFAELHGLNRPTAKARIEELSRLLELSEFLDRKAKGFSQGQRLKTALARALVHSPKNLILDEPTNGLDVMAVRNLRALLHRLREQGHCILFSSHVMQEVALLCDEVVVIAQGRVAASGTIESLRAEAGEASLEDAFVKLIGTAEGLN
ncbi:MAG: ATP-binding cassette domain-containing protein [Gammaproteobacteria bacterium]